MTQTVSLLTVGMHSTSQTQHIQLRLRLICRAKKKLPKSFQLHSWSWINHHRDEHFIYLKVSSGELRKSSLCTMTADKKAFQAYHTDILTTYQAKQSLSFHFF